jgi:hypothetical protein
VPPLDQPHYGIGFRIAVQRVFWKVTTLEGRASLSEHWWWALFQGVVLLVLYPSVTEHDDPVAAVALTADASVNTPGSQPKTLSSGPAAG